PMTKIRYVQGPFESSLADGLFAQNVAQGTNLMLGFQRHVTDGRFANSAYDSWQIRGRLRYNFSDRFNVSLSEFYSSSTNGMNGGIDALLSPSIYDEVTAIVRNEEASDHISRHDVTLNGVARLFNDSTSATYIALYFSERDREYNDVLQSASERTVSSLLGARLRQNLSGRSLHTAVGVDVEQARVLGGPLVGFRSENRAALFGNLSMRVLASLQPEASVRAEQRGSASALSYGFGLKAFLGNFPSLRGDYASSFRFSSPPPLLSVDASAAQLQFSGREKHETVALGFDLNLDSDLQLSVTAFDRSVFETFSGSIAPDSEIVYRIIPKIASRGVAGQFSFHWWKLEGITTWIFSEMKQSPNTLTPKWSATGEIAYRDTVLKDVMELRTGLRFRAATRHQGMQFHPRTGIYVESSGTEIESFSAIDFFLVANLGDAYLTLSWENILNERYMTTSLYPMPGRTLRFGVNWVFID
ncbi:MAG: putative porin, partial [Bacteroidota bacterium]